MSKQIDWTQPVSPEEAAWAEQFPNLHNGMLAVNREQYPDEVEDEPSLDGKDDEVPPYTEWTKAELESEIRRRNSEESKTLKVTGTQPQLAKVLEDDDAASTGE